MKRLLSIAALLLLLASPAWAAVFAPASGSPDTFNGTAATELHAYNPLWVNGYGDTSTTVITTPNGYAESVSYYNTHYYYNISPATADYSVQCDVVPLTTSFSGPAGRMALSSLTYYNVEYATGEWKLEAFVNGTITTIGTYTQAVTTGQTYTVALSMQGTTISVSVNGTQIISVTDTSIASGYPGFFLVSNNEKITNWEATQSASTNSYSWTMTGGGISGGSTPYYAGRIYAMTGGAVAGGSTAYTRGAVVAMSGGGIAGGLSAYSRGKVYAMTGGGVMGGSASYSSHTAGVQSYSWIMTGGAVAGGAASYIRSVLRAMAGGGIAGGSAAAAKGRGYTMTGGAVAGGAVAYIRGMVRTMTEGAVAGGAAFFTRLAHFIMSGGGIAGGSSLYSISAHVSTFLHAVITGSGPSVKLSGSGPTIGITGSGPRVVIKGGAN